MHLFCDACCNFNLFERLENQAAQAESKNGWINALHKNLSKGGVKNDFVGR